MERNTQIPAFLNANPTRVVAYENCCITSNSSTNAYHYSRWNAGYKSLRTDEG